MAETNIEKNDKYLVEKLREHTGWAEVKIKNGYIIEVHLKVNINMK